MIDCSNGYNGQMFSKHTKNNWSFNDDHFYDLIECSFDELIVACRQKGDLWFWDIWMGFGHFLLDPIGGL